MKHTNHPMRYALSAAIALALAPTLAAAQDAAPAAAKDDATTLDAVVVSGTAKFKGLRKRDASFSSSGAMGMRMATHNRLKAVWITAMPGRVAASPRMAGAKIARTIE